MECQVNTNTSQFIKNQNNDIKKLRETLQIIYNYGGKWNDSPKYNAEKYNILAKQIFAEKFDSLSGELPGMKVLIKLFFQKGKEPYCKYCSTSKKIKRYFGCNKRILYCLIKHYFILSIALKTLSTSSGILKYVFEFFIDIDSIQKLRDTIKLMFTDFINTIQESVSRDKIGRLYNICNVRIDKYDNDSNFRSTIKYIDNMLNFIKKVFKVQKRKRFGLITR